MTEKNIKMEYDWKYKNTQEYTTYNWMINDLYRGVQTNSNYLVTLGIMTYSEAIGWVMRGSDPKDKNNLECFRAFTDKYIPQISLSTSLYSKIRNGLVHLYFIKGGNGQILEWNEIEARPDYVIDVVDEENIKIYFNIYFKDFVDGIVKYIEDDARPRGPSINNATNFEHGQGYSGYSPEFSAGLGATGPVSKE